WGRGTASRSRRRPPRATWAPCRRTALASRSSTLDDALLRADLLPIDRFITDSIAAKSHWLKSLFIQQPAHRPQDTWLSATTLKVTALTSAPRLPTPAPECESGASR